MRRSSASTGARVRPVSSASRKPNRRSHRSRSCYDAGPMPSDKIVVRGAREHNLKNLDVEMPRDRLIVITGLSGSGKSSLAFDTIYAEGQRRYVESLSAYARQFLGQMEKPDVDQIDGLSPAISIDQKGASKNPRSTVGTVTEIYDYLRLLFARIGRMHCPICGREIERQTVEQMVDRIYALPEGTRVMLMAPLVRDRKGEHEKLLAGAKQAGFVRVRVDGELLDLDEEIKLDKKYKHSIEVVVDRLVVRTADDEGAPRPDASRMADSIETALRLSDGLLLVNQPDVPAKEADELYSERYACPEHGGSFEEPAPRNFSFNSPHGACPDCTGLGSRLEIDPDMVLPNDELSVDEGRDPAVAPDGDQRHLVRKDPRRGRGALRLPHRCSGARPVGRGAPDPRLRERRRAHPGPLPGPQRERPHLSDDVRGDRAEPPATPPRDGLGGDACRDRALHDEQAVPVMQRDAAEAGVAVGDDRRAQHHRDDASLRDRCAGLVRRPAQAPDRAREPDRAPGPEGDSGAARVPHRRRPGLPDPRPRVGDAQRRRGAAHSAGHADRLEPDGGALHPRRAVDRPPPARQRPADRHPGPAPRPREHAARGRARRGDDSVRGLGHRHRPGGGGARRPPDPLGAAAGAARQPSVDHGRISPRRQGRARAEAATERQGRGDRGARRTREQPEGASTSPSHSAGSLPSPASAAPASRAW